MRNARAISRYRSSARSNGRNNLPRLDESDEAVACTKQHFFRVSDSNPEPPKIPKKRGIFGPRGSARPGRIVHLADIFAVPELGKHPRGFVTASLFRVFRFSALDVHSHVDILTRHENGRCAHPKPIARKPSGASRATDTPRRSHARSPRGARRTPEGRARARPRVPRTRRRWRQRDARRQVRFCPPFCRRDRHGEPRNDAASWRPVSNPLLERLTRPPL